MAEKCWRIRECEIDMNTMCMHAVTDYDMCPSRCMFAVCDRPTHVLTSDPSLVFSAEIDRDQALKQMCIYCEHFLTRGPKLQAKKNQ